jgi:O-succinylbenzoic acid--CoA ligase
MTDFPFLTPNVAAAFDPGNIVWMHDGNQLNYRELSQDALNLAATLLDQGVRGGDLVVVVTLSPILTARLAYASLVLGVTLFPLDPTMTGVRRNWLLSDAGCDLVISDVELGDLPAGIRLIPAQALGAAGSAPLPQDWDQGGAGGDIQLVIATSGSEGNPKGVMLSRDNLAASVSASRRRLGLEAGDLWLCCLPLSHIGGISILYRCLDAGAGVLLHPGFDAQGVWQDLLRQRVTHISLVPAMLARLLDISEDASPPEWLRIALIGGGHLVPELAVRAHAAGWPLCVSYGMSETASQCAVRCGPGAGLIPGEVGVPLDGIEIALSQRGRIMLRGPVVMRGYINPDRTPGLGLLDGGWFESGDLGELDGSGRLRVLGRADELLISGGRNIHPIEVEALLAVCPGVGQVAITGQADLVWGVRLVALYTGLASVAEVEQWCRDNIASAWRPRRYIRVQELPQNSLGKLDRTSLLDLLVQA